MATHVLSIPKCRRTVPATRWVLFKSGQPLLAEVEKKRSLARLTTADVKLILGSEPFFSQGQHAGDPAAAPVPILEAARFHGPPIVFLGLHEPDINTADALPSSDFSAKTDPVTVIANIKGTPYFSLDVSDVEQKELEETLQNAEVSKNGATLLFSEGRAAMDNFDSFEAAVFAEGRSMTDWNGRNKVRASRSRITSTHPLACTVLSFLRFPGICYVAGWKLSCTSLVPWADNTGKKPCATATGLHNFAHPRSDGVVIMAAVDETGEKILLGRNKKWPPKFWSALAGFIEPGESFEDAVRRELWEEAGVRARDVTYHSTQPWPFPANIMAGFYATVSSSDTIRTDLDNELEDARWYSREEVLAVITHGEGTKLSKGDHKQLSWASDQAADAPKTNAAGEPTGDALKTTEAPPVVSTEAPFRLPRVLLSRGCSSAIGLMAGQDQACVPPN
ncbi:Peroxisomal NADH pyrophosphatase NUDT12 [Grifola frondosa]|uniref:NAD(+) diphosphatase n=1 Tax=Grifola frondosa TaxID=5627 RepID=A0A1C7M3L2_GRIFR|nr:Peroxisomal NADH pyrophosphatase NUDT12 [Grifola frondosa]